MTGLARKAIRSLPSGVKSRLRTAVHPAQGLRLRRVLGPKSPDLGVLTVVIPTFNVEAYLVQCLDSVISQSYANLEVVIVDDGSTDSTLKIAKDYARWDKRIRVIGLEHGGNGRARNIGIASARGTFLTFADSDDIVAVDAYLTMMLAIHRSGSDFVVGSSDRLVGSKRVPTKLATRLHAEARLAVSLAEFPEILDDVFLWNKLFQRTFWDLQVGPLPEGLLYEDQETTARAYVRAARFDVLPDVVYSWRQRPDGKSITQGKGDLKNLQDRLIVAQSVSQLLLADAEDEAVQVWCQRLFGSDLTPYFDLVANRGDDYWETLQSGVSGLIRTFEASGSILDSTWHSMDPHARVYLTLAAAGSREAVEDVIVDRIDSGTGFEVFQEDGRFVALPNYWEELEQTQGTQALACSAESLAFESGIRLRDLQDGRGPVLRGHAYIRGLASSVEMDSIRVLFLLVNGSERLVPITRIEDPRIDVDANDAFASHVRSGFEIDMQDYPELATATSARVELSVGDASWSAVHSLKITETLEACHRVAEGIKPLVVGFAVDEASEKFAIDVVWGSSHASEHVYLSTSQVQIDPADTVHLSAGVRRYSFELHHLHWGRQVYSYPSGAYTLRHKATQSGKALPIQASSPLGIKSPLEHSLKHSNLSGWVTPTNSFAVSIGAPLTMVERSKYGQRQLQKSFNESDAVEDHVLIESFGGGSCTDSPRALAESLRSSDANVTIYCSVTDHSVPVPEFMLPLIQGTASWFKSVRTARLLINNNIFPFFFRKGPKQVYLQTWHGTPIKKIGAHAPKTFISPSYRRGVLREADSWTGLVAQNAYAKDIFAECFNYHGPIFCLGYPRNDNLVRAQNFRSDIRESLSLTAKQVAVLVAPTWRDDSYRAGIASGHGNLDLEFLLDASPEHYRFLVRSHQNEVGMGALARHRKVLNVSSHPDINDLFIASDCLITDYSSLAFDYLNTDKPILVHMSHDSNYEKVRGTYLILTELFDSQVAHSMPSLLSLLTRVNSGEASSQKMKQIRDVYAPMDDGNASGRVLQGLDNLAQEVI